MSSKLGTQAIIRQATIGAEECLKTFLERSLADNPDIRFTEVEILMLKEAYKFGFIQGADYFGKSILEAEGTVGTLNG